MPLLVEVPVAGLQTLLYGEGRDFAESNKVRSSKRLAARDRRARPIVCGVWDPLRSCRQCHVAQTRFPRNPPPPTTSSIIGHTGQFATPKQIVLRIALVVLTGAIAYAAGDNVSSRERRAPVRIKL